MSKRVAVAIAIFLAVGACGPGGDVVKARNAAPVCGNIFVEPGEVCDDGVSNGDGWTLERHCNTECTGWGPHCGDGFRNAAERCDDGANNRDGWALTAHCNSVCMLFDPYCGDGALDPEEVCDEGANNSDSWARTPHCNATCTGPAGFCGDGVANGEDQCDGADLKQATCESRVNQRGELRCNERCFFDTSACHGYCNNGKCDFDESAVDCPAECYCGNRTCDAGENRDLCPQDCDICGDGRCIMDETIFNCAADCAAPASMCGNGICDLGENRDRCPLDCATCGDGSCADDEDQYLCPADCGAVAIAETCVLLADRTVRCWGRGLFSTPIRAEGLWGVVDMTMATDPEGDMELHALGDDGTVARWQPGQRPAAVPDLLDAIDLAGNCVLRADRTVVCWQGDVVTPVRGLSEIVKIAHGSRSSSSGFCAIRNDRSVWCWWTDAVRPPWQVPGVQDAIALSIQTVRYPNYWSTDAVEMCALLSDATAYCTDPTWSELGILSVPIVAIGVKPTQACVMREDGTASCAGLELSEYQPCHCPPLHDLGTVPGLQGVKAFSTNYVTGQGQRAGCPTNCCCMASGSIATCALLVSGQVWCWGDNYGFDLGVIGIENSDVPVPVAPW